MPAPENGSIFPLGMLRPMAFMLRHCVEDIGGSYGPGIRFGNEQGMPWWANNALPIGNGRLGCMVFGAEPLQLNEDALWAERAARVK